MPRPHLHRFSFLHSSWNSNSKQTTGEVYSNEKSQRIQQCNHKALAAATIPIETRISKGEKLWDQDFSSMSSYGSHDLELLMESSNAEQENGRYPSSGTINVKMRVSGDDLEEEESATTMKKKRKVRRQRLDGSLSAALPPDTRGPTKSSIPLVINSYDPFQDYRNSVMEMVRENAIYEWHELQELLYCYVALNSLEQHQVIKSAFVDVMMELLNDQEQDYDWP